MGVKKSGGNRKENVIAVLLIVFDGEVMTNNLTVSSIPAPPVCLTLAT